MDFLELAEKRYSVRKFNDTPVPQEMVDKILKAARIAPTAANNQPQKIFVIQSQEARDKVKKCTDCHFNAPLIFLICNDKNVNWVRPFDGKTSGDVDASIITTHMMMEACELGLGTTWVMFFKPDVLISELGLPENLEPIALLPTGFPAETAKPAPSHTQYRDEKEVVTYL